MLEYTYKSEDVLKKLNVDPKQGLESFKAKELLEKYGYNKLKEKEPTTIFQRFVNQFKDLMIIILVVAALISFIIAIYEGESESFFEPIAILCIVVLNAIMGVIQENKAEKALQALQNLSAPHARVLRDGKETIVESMQVVPGDIIKLEAGDFIPADARIINSYSLKSEESALTGESVPVDKNANAVIDEKAPLGDRVNMVYSGCSIAYGTGTAVVTSTGMNTEIGKIANLLEEADEVKTPMQLRLEKLGRYLGVIAIAACAIIFVIGLLNSIPIMEIFMTSVSLAVSAIPEGLPAIVTVVLSIGVQRMVKRNAIIRKLPAVETLGSASVICSDKTGTLTQNRMTLVKAYEPSKKVFEDITNNNSDSIKSLLKLSTLCCNGSVEIENGVEKHLGDPTETAIVLAAYKNGIDKKSIDREFPRLLELPFDSNRKLMTTVNSINGKNMVIVKGAFDVLLSKCKKESIAAAKEYNEEMSKDALRVIAVACKEIDELPANPSFSELESNLVFVGLLGMIDPPRPEVKGSVEICRKAGIKPVMITGDHVITASAIAKDLGILKEGDKAVTGAELANMTDEELVDEVKNISVYARVSPEDKIRIVKAWQSCGEVVSMTGDGVNDAPALKAADIGCAMGITGTDVAKDAADITLTDDNFSTIVEAVREGRGIYDNIKKTVVFLLGTNIGEVLTVFFSMLIWHQSPLLSMQLLWINLVTDSFPAIALGMEKVESDVMLRKPKPKNEGIFSNGAGVRVFVQGAMFALMTMFGFYYGNQVIGTVNGGRTMAFIILSMSQIIHSFNMRSRHSIFKIGVFTNKYLNLAVLASSLMVILIVFIPPLASVFGIVSLPVYMYVEAFLAAFISIVVVETLKFFKLIKE